MKQSILLPFMAMLSIHCNAMALVADPLLLRPIYIAGQPAGVGQILALGPGLPPAKVVPPEQCVVPGDSCPPPEPPPFPLASFGTCLYRLRWYPVGGHSFIPCDLSELRTSSSWGCYFDQTINYPTIVTAGPGALIPTSFCAGFDQYGISHITGDIALVMGEMPFTGPVILPNLFGTAVYPSFFPLPQSIAL